MEFYLGQLVLGSFAITPRGLIPCDGRLLPIGSYQALYSLLGTTFGGDGVNNFAVPDLRGRAALGAGPGYGLGQKAGQETAPLTLAQFPAHTHAMRATSSSTAGPVAGAIFANSGTASAYGPAPASPPVTMQAQAMLDAGGGLGHENRQPYLVMNWFIAVTGIWPPRS